VRVSLQAVDHGWRLRIDDDGDGFVPPNGRSTPSHLGLTAMRERAQLAGGWCKIESRPGSGTSISMWVSPVQQAPETVAFERSGSPACPGHTAGFASRVPGPRRDRGRGTLSPDSG